MKNGRQQLTAVWPVVEDQSLQKCGVNSVVFNYGSNDRRLTKRRRMRVKTSDPALAGFSPELGGEGK
jgi:hypothetical protein